jgi:dihydroxyacetone kinase
VELTSATLRTAVSRAADAARAAHDELNVADGKLGDGDTGVMLRRLWERIAAAAPDGEADLGATFQAFAAASASGTGSSLGTLVTVAMLTLAKATRGRNEIAWSELGDLLEQVRDAMMKRGGASLGDKTMIDMLDAVARAISRLGDSGEIARTALATARATLEDFRPRPNRIGRARMFAERSVGLDDPGMLAFLRLLEGLAAAR